jgi:hypothetical protein
MNSQYITSNNKETTTLEKVVVFKKIRSHIAHTVSAGHVWQGEALQ